MRVVHPLLHVYFYLFIYYGASCANLTIPAWISFDFYLFSLFIGLIFNSFMISDRFCVVLNSKLNPINSLGYVIAYVFPYVIA